MESAERSGISKLYSTDQADDDAALKSQDLTFIKAAVEQTGSRLESRFIAWATVFVALSGVVGAVVGGLVAHFLG